MRKPLRSFDPGALFCFFVFFLVGKAMASVMSPKFKPWIFSESVPLKMMDNPFQVSEEKNV